MRTGLIAKKIGMSSMFTPKGERIPLTFLELEDCQVVGHKTIEKNGYDALVIGTKNVKRISKVSKSMKKVYADLKIEPKVLLKEFRITDDCFIDVGTNLEVDHFSQDQYVDIVGISQGKGFAGCMKRWNFRGLEASHGVSISHRSHGSTGGRQDPGRVFKGKKMAGHMGGTQVTIQNLKIEIIDKDRRLIMVGGNVPGSKGSYVYIKDAIKKTVKVLEAI